MSFNDQSQLLMSMLKPTFNNFLSTLQSSKTDVTSIAFDQFWSMFMSSISSTKVTKENKTEKSEKLDKIEKSKKKAVKTKESSKESSKEKEFEVTPSAPAATSAPSKKKVVKKLASATPTSTPPTSTTTTQPTPNTFQATSQSIVTTKDKEEATKPKKKVKKSVQVEAHSPSNSPLKLSESSSSDSPASVKKMFGKEFEVQVPFSNSQLFDFVNQAPVDYTLPSNSKFWKFTPYKLPGYFMDVFHHSTTNLVVSMQDPKLLTHPVLVGLLIDNKLVDTNELLKTQKFVISWARMSNIVVKSEADKEEVIINKNHQNKEEQIETTEDSAANQACGSGAFIKQVHVNPFLALSQSFSSCSSNEETSEKDELSNKRKWDDLWDASEEEEEE